ncbi:homeodomain-only protein-like protein [Leptotrombidium deliense]|uniref:Homeodomain-only protein-like protein n=1 Tax=Leptotrombidium deliense TaxID=299467 RepID=A0A443SK28_9ACAR|nr:homeodomain-only protein-like protein [Leptotrombidium deliense]
MNTVKLKQTNRTSDRRIANVHFDLAASPQLAPNHLLPSFDYRQELLLQDLFEKKKNPTDSDFEILAMEASISIFHAKVWFEDRLAKWRQSQGLPSSMRRVSEIV